MSLSGKLSVGMWKIRLREKWNMVKIDVPMFEQVKKSGICKTSSVLKGLNDTKHFKYK
jgi:hypothetical protein